MAVTRVPSGFEPVVEGLQQIGQALIQRKFRDRIRAQQIRNNPEAAAQIARMVRDSSPEQVGQSLDLDPQFLAQLSEAIPASIEEQQEEAFEREGGPEAVGRQAAIAAQTDIERLRQIQDSGVLEEGPRAEALQAEVNSRAARVAMDLGLPEAEGQLRDLKLDQQADAIRDLNNFMEGLPEDHPWQMFHDAGLVNQSFLSAIMQERRMSLQERMSRLRAATDRRNPREIFEEQLGLTQDLRDLREQALDELDAAREDPGGGRLDAAIDNLNDAVEWQRRAIELGVLPGGTVTTATGDPGFFGTEAEGVEFGTEESREITPEDQVEQLITQGLISGEVTQDELTQPTITNAEGEEVENPFWKLPIETRSRIINNWTVATAESPPGGDIIEKVVGGDVRERPRQEVEELERRRASLQEERRRRAEAGQPVEEVVNELLRIEQEIERVSGIAEGEIFPGVNASIEAFRSLFIEDEPRVSPKRGGGGRR